MKESFPSGKNMNRREFLKTAGAVAVGAAVGTKVEAQETQRVIDDSVGRSIRLATQEKIIFPDKFDPIPEEAKKVLFTIQNYQELPPGSPEVPRATAAVWEEIKKLAPGLPDEYSDVELSKAYTNILPKYFAQFGIFIEPDVNFNAPIKKGIPTTFIAPAYFKISAFMIRKVEHDEVVQDGIKVKRDILRSDGVLVINGHPIYNPDSGVINALTIFQNIIIIDEALQKNFQEFNASFQVAKKNNPGWMAGQYYESLQRDNRLESAVGFSTDKMIAEAGDIDISYEEYEATTIAHETRHLIDAMTINLNKTIPFKITSDAQEHMRGVNNLGIHQEINPILSQLQAWKHKGLMFNAMVHELIQVGTKSPSHYNLANRWIIRKMIEIISRNPGKYGIKIDKTNLSNDNQIISQLWVLPGKPELLNELCDQVKAIHNANLTEDLSANMSYPGTQIESKQHDNTLKKVLVAVPLVGGAAFALKKLQDRKKEVAAKEATMSKGQIRRAKKKKK